MKINGLLSLFVLLSIPVVAAGSDIGPFGGSGSGSKTWRITANGAQTISGVRIRAGNRIDAISFTVSSVQDNFNHQRTEQYGGSGGTEYEFTLDNGECITEVIGKMGVAQNRRNTQSVFSLQFRTNRGRRSQTYGNTNEGTDFHIQVDDGEEINGFFGHYGAELDSIGVVTRSQLNCV